MSKCLHLNPHLRPSGTTNYGQWGRCGHRVALSSLAHIVPKHARRSSLARRGSGSQQQGSLPLTKPQRRKKTVKPYLEMSYPYLTLILWLIPGVCSRAFDLSPRMEPVRITRVLLPRLHPPFKEHHLFLAQRVNRKGDPMQRPPSKTRALFI